MIKRGFCFFLILALTCSLVFIPQSSYGHNEEWTIDSDYGTTPKIDGQFDPSDEWADAHSVEFNAFYGDVTVYTKAIPNYLYLAYYLPFSGEDIGWVSFTWDPLHDLGEDPQVDDRGLVANFTFPGVRVIPFQFWEGTGTSWNAVDEPVGFLGEIGFSEKKIIVEMAIPYEWLGIEICEEGPRGCQFGLMLYEPDGDSFSYYWPSVDDTSDGPRCTPDLWGNMVPSDCWGSPRGRLIVEEGPNSPSDHNYDPGDEFNEMIQLKLTADLEQSINVIPENVYLKDLTITATGTGNDQTDIANVFLVEDSNQDGLYDDTETILAQGIYSADDGSITFFFPDPGLLIELGEPKYLLVVYVMNPSPPAGATYQFFLSGVNATGEVSEMAVPVQGYREQLPVTTAVLWRYTLFSALKTVPGPSEKPSLSIQKLATADSVLAGEDITYNIIVANVGDTTLYGVSVTDTIPASTTFVDAPATSWGPSGAFDPASGTVTWDLGDMAPGDWNALKLVVKVDPATPDETIIHNKAVAHSTSPPLTVESEDEVVVVGGRIHEGYIKGYTGDLGQIFGPQRNVTRAEIAAIIARLLHLESTVTGQQFYPDVPDWHWSFKYVEAVTKADIMKGFPDGNFYPDIPATRADVAVVMIRARGLDPVVFLPSPPFPDISGHWAIKEIETAYVLGVVEGFPDGTFHPLDPIIRAETVTLIDRALGRGPLLEGPVLQHFPDCTISDWFYGWGEESFASHKGVRMPSGNEKLLEYIDTGPIW